MHNEDQVSFKGKKIEVKDSSKMRVGPFCVLSIMYFYKHKPQSNRKDKTECKKILLLSKALKLDVMSILFLSCICVLK